MYYLKRVKQTVLLKSFKQTFPNVLTCSVVVDGPNKSPWKLGVVAKELINYSY